jgi:hypothetical protein
MSMYGKWWLIRMRIPFKNNDLNQWKKVGLLAIGRTFRFGLQVMTIWVFIFVVRECNAILNSNQFNRQPIFKIIIFGHLVTHSENMNFALKWFRNKPWVSLLRMLIRKRRSLDDPKLYMLWQCYQNIISIILSIDDIINVIVTPY